MFVPFHGHLDSLRYHDNGKAFPEGFAKGYVVTDSLNGEWNLRDQDDVGSPGNPGLQRDPARVPSHDLDHHDAMVRLSCGVDFVDSIGCGHERSIETECDLGGGKVVVDGFGHADDVHALFEKVESDLLRAVPTNADHSVDSELTRVGDDRSE